MIKQDLRLFFASFFITLLLAGWMAAFLIVDSSSSRYENTTIAPAFSLTRKDDLHVDLDLLGTRYTLYLDQLNQMEAWRKKHACLVTLRPVRAAEQAYGLAVYGWKKFSASYREYEYQQNVEKSKQTASP